MAVVVGVEVHQVVLVDLLDQVDFLDQVVEQLVHPVLVVEQQEVQVLVEKVELLGQVDHLEQVDLMDHQVLVEPMDQVDHQVIVEPMDQVEYLE
jgi:hypothetical protein